MTGCTGWSRGWPTAPPTTVASSPDGMMQPRNSPKYVKNSTYSQKMLPGSGGDPGGGVQVKENALFACQKSEMITFSHVCGQKFSDSENKSKMQEKTPQFSSTSSGYRSAGILVQFPRGMSMSTKVEGKFSVINTRESIGKTKNTNVMRRTVRQHAFDCRFLLFVCGAKPSPQIEIVTQHSCPAK